MELTGPVPPPPPPAAAAVPQLTAAAAAAARRGGRRRRRAAGARGELFAARRCEQDRGGFVAAVHVRLGRARCDQGGDGRGGRRERRRGPRRRRRPRRWRRTRRHRCCGRGAARSRLRRAARRRRPRRSRRSTTFSTRPAPLSRLVVGRHALRGAGRSARARRARPRLRREAVEEEEEEEPLVALNKQNKAGGADDAAVVAARLERELMASCVLAGELSQARWASGELLKCIEHLDEGYASMEDYIATEFPGFFAAPENHIPAADLKRLKNRCRQTARTLWTTGGRRSRRTRRASCTRRRRACRRRAGRRSPAERDRGEGAIRAAAAAQRGGGVQGAGGRGARGERARVQADGRVDGVVQFSLEQQLPRRRPSCSRPKS